MTLELGGNAGVIVHADADPDFAAQRIAFGGYYQAGQSCISVQQVLVSSEVYEDFTARLVKQIESLKVGDPLDPTVDVGPVIQRKEVDRLTEWVNEAVSQGAEVLTGGTGDGPFFEPSNSWQTCGPRCGCAARRSSGRSSRSASTRRSRKRSAS